MFTAETLGQRPPYSSLMQSFKPGSLLSKKGPSQKRRKIVDLESIRVSQNKSVQYQPQSSEKPVTALLATSAEVPASERRDASNPRSYGNRKNYTELDNNYSYKV